MHACIYTPGSLHNKVINTHAGTHAHMRVSFSTSKQEHLCINAHISTRIRPAEASTGATNTRNNSYMQKRGGLAAVSVLVLCLPPGLSLRRLLPSSCPLNAAAAAAAAAASDTAAS
jgi:hypothetical protein